MKTDFHGHRPEIDGLRAISVLAVIFFHAGFDWCQGGFVGVDVFFVISGYLITGIILEQKAAGNFSLVDFYVRRARRILPALFVVVLVCLPIAWLWMAPLQLKRFAWSIAAVPLFGSNFLFARTTGYFEPAAEEQPLLHTWSLAVEEQYYLFFPLLLVALWRFGVARIATVTAAIALLSLALAEWGWRSHPGINFYFTFSRAWELLLGALLACVAFARPLYDRVSPTVAQVASSTGLLLIAGAVVLYDRDVPFPSAYALLPTIGAGLVLTFANANNLAGQLVSQRALVGIGLISYSAYLWHYPLFAFATIRSQAPELGAGTAWAIITATLLLAFLTWKHVETPWRRRVALPRARVFALAAACSVGFVALGIIGHVGNGFVSRLTDEQRAAYERIRASDAGGPPAGPCQFQTETVDAEFTERFAKCAKQHRALVIIGDSHGYDLYHAVVFNATRPFIASMSLGGCRPYPEKPNCHYERARRFVLAHHQSIDAVLFAQAGSYYLGNEEAIKRTQAYLTSLSGHAKVFWLGPKAEPNIDVQNMNVLFREFSPRDEKLEKQAMYPLDELLVARNANQPFSYISTIKTVRYYFATDFFVDGKYTYSDTDHWSTWGEKYFGARLLNNDTLHALLTGNQQVTTAGARWKQSPQTFRVAF